LTTVHVGSYHIALFFLIYIAALTR